MPDSIGSRLKQTREARSLTLDKAAEATRIRRHYLQALENDDYSIMSSAAQGRGFLRIYADYLGLNLDQLTAGLRAEAATTPPASDTPAPVPPAEAPPRPAAEPSPAEPASILEGTPLAAAPAPETEPVLSPEAEAAALPLRAPRRAGKSPAARPGKSARGGKSASKKKPAGKSKPAAKKKSPVKKNSRPSRRSKS